MTPGDPFPPWRSSSLSRFFQIFLFLSWMNNKKTRITGQGIIKVRFIKWAGFFQVPLKLLKFQGNSLHSYVAFRWNLRIRCPGFRFSDGTCKCTVCCGVFLTFWPNYWDSTIPSIFSVHWQFIKDLFYFYLNAFCSGPIHNYLHHLSLIKEQLNWKEQPKWQNKLEAESKRRNKPYKILNNLCIYIWWAHVFLER